MAEPGALPATDGRGTPEPAKANRFIRRHRGLPGGRAVVGALLVSATAVVVFAAYLDANAEPTTRYLVADQPVQPGTVIEDRTMALELFSAAPIDLLTPVDQRVYPVEELEALVGQVLLTPLERGELLQRSAVLDASGVGDTQVMSFSVPRAAAVAGELLPGERIDVLATYTASGDSYTAFVVRGVPLLGISSGTGSGANAVLLTVGLTAPEDVQALGHAVNTASVFVSRSTVSADDTDSVPAPYAPSPDDAAEDDGAEVVE